IRDFHVTGVQTCALPIYARAGRPRARTGREGGWNRKLGTAGHLIAARLRAHLNLPVKVTGALLGIDATTVSHATSRTASILAGRSEERRVGKECRARVAT